MQPMPGCTEKKDGVKPTILFDRQGQKSCASKMVQYECTDPTGWKSLSKRPEYFLPGAEGQGDVFSSGPRSETPAQAGPVPSERWWVDEVLFPDAGAQQGWPRPDIRNTPYGIPVAGFKESQWVFLIENFYGVHENSTSVPKVNELVQELNQLQAQKAPLEKEKAALEKQRTRVNSARRKAHWKDQKLENEYKRIDRRLQEIGGRISDIADEYNKRRNEIKARREGYTKAREAAGIMGQKYPDPALLNFPY
jgi:hypothetical protein